jgi:hypothetical protein
MALGRIDRGPFFQRYRNEPQIFPKKYLLSIPLLQLRWRRAGEAERGCLGRPVGQVVPDSLVALVVDGALLRVHMALNLGHLKTCRCLPLVDR